MGAIFAMEAPQPLFLDVSEGRGFFASQLNSVTPKDAQRWIWLAYDQLNLTFLEGLGSDFHDFGIILIESSQKGRSMPFHQQKLAFLLSNQRHFALEVQAQGLPVYFLSTDQDFSDALEGLGAFGVIEAFQPAERSLRTSIASLAGEGKVVLHPHPGWLTSRECFEQSVGTEPPFRMDKFYRTVRKEKGWLMEDGKPVGGKFSFDAENRAPWKGEHEPPPAPKYSIDEIDEEVTELVEHVFGDHPGRIDLSTLPTSRAEAEQALAYARRCLPHFGRYEDAMTEKSIGLFHSRLASLTNLHRVMPIQILQAILAEDAPLNSVEGFLRQMIWREYVHHIHDLTDGFRSLDLQRSSAQRGARWQHASELSDEGHPNFLNQDEALPQAYWGAESGLRCLDACVKPVMDEGWTHHIPRLMVLSNVAHLLDVNPRELTDWFHAAFIDAYDWVVEPNVLGMGTFALGTAMMTKPYVAGSAYINRMSDHCKSCSFHPKKNCPMTRLYWAYLERHGEAFEGNHRMSMTLRNVQRRSPEEKNLDVATFEHVKQVLSQGGMLRPNGVEDLRQWSS